MNHPSHLGRIPRVPARAGARAVCLLLAATQPLAAQRVPITFDDYHGFQGTVDYLQRVARSHGDITELVEIGRTTMNRPIYVLVISKMSDGTTIDRHVQLRNPRQEGVQNVTPMKPYHGKPGVWIDGGTHGNEYTGTEVALYIADKLLSGYGSDPAIKRLVDENVFYICPMVNPDGVFQSVDRGISQRQNIQMVDDDEDGRVNEDGPDDLDGDGKITSFRYPDPQGRWVTDDADPRLMIQLGQGETTTKPTFSVIREDKDNDGDGRRGEDGEGGIDVNRNFPEGWFNDQDLQGGSGFYPSSSPEAHAILEFFTNTRNILMVQSFHTSGGFTYRPFARWPDSRVDPRDLGVFDRIMGPKYVALHGEGADAARLWRPPYNTEQNRPYGYGIFIDWAYAQYGAYSMTTELWNWQRDTRGLPGYSGEEDRNVWYRALLANLGSVAEGKSFVPWKRSNHPELGQGEVGGWVSTYVGGNALPGESLRGIAEIHWQFELFKAGLLPREEISDARAEILTTAGAQRIVKVTATVANTGALPTHLARGARLAGNRDDAIWLLGERDRIRYLQGGAWQSLGTLEGTTAIPGAAPAAGAPGQRRTASPAEGPFQAQRATPARVAAQQAGGAQAGNTREVTWLVAMEGDFPLKLVLTSQKGGTKVREVTVR
jgi:hypothetical protein